VRSQLQRSARASSGKHRLDASGTYDREKLAQRVPVERLAAGTTRRHPRCAPTRGCRPLAAEAERVVEVLRLVGSIVNAKRSRRSVRSASSSSGGGGTGACGRRTPSCQRRPSSTAPTSLGRPSTDSTFARPRPDAGRRDRRRRIAASLAVDGDRNAALEERLAHQELPAPGELGDEDFQPKRRACVASTAPPRGSSRRAA
jgi:hypothetical protein